MLKNIENRINDEKTFRETISTLRWIHDNQISIHWNSIYQVQLQAFQTPIRDHLADALKPLYEEIISSIDSEIATVIQKHKKAIELNEEFLRGFYKDIREDVNHSYKNSSFLIQNYSRKQREEFKTIYNIPSSFKEMDEQLKDSAYSQGIIDELECIYDITGLSDKYYDTMLDKYTGACDAHIKCLIQFALLHSIEGPIRYNDLADLNHTYYLYNKTCKIITDDKGLVDLVRKGLGRDRYAMTVDEYLSNH